MCEVDGFWNVWKYLKIRNIKNLLKKFLIKCDTHQMTSGGDFGQTDRDERFALY